MSENAKFVIRYLIEECIPRLKENLSKDEYDNFINGLREISECVDIDIDIMDTDGVI